MQYIFFNLREFLILKIAKHPPILSSNIINARFPRFNQVWERYRVYEAIRSGKPAS